MRLLIIDGNAILHRAYHALPPLTNKTGEVVNAVYGFFSMLLKIMEEIKPEFLAVCFDRPKPTFRKAMYAGYQAKRPKMADDLSSQIVIVHTALEQIGIPIFEVDGYEADDLIGTLSVQAVELNLDQAVEVIIVSGDRDLLQLVNHKVKMLAPITGISNMILFDSAKVQEKFGIEPKQIIDYKALVGDNSDGYPGVSGIGPKTAAMLLKKFGSFEEIYTNLGKIEPKLAERLAIDAEQAALAKKLATIILDAPISLDLEKCAVLTSWPKAMQIVFTGLGFTSLQKRLKLQISVKEVEQPGEQLGLL